MKFSRPALSILLASSPLASSAASTQAGNEAGNETGHPVNYGLILFPFFQSLDVFGPIDILNSISRSVHMNLHIIAETLDPVSTAPLVPNAINSSFAESVVPTHTFADPPPDLDVLIIPGGGGTRVPPEDMPDLLNYVRDVYPSLQYLITICTGSRLLAQTGVLDGRRATSNKRAWNTTTPLGPRTYWVAQARWVADGNIWTSSGISAGIDATFAWVEHVFGKELADETAVSLEYERITDPSHDVFAGIWGAVDVPPVESA